MSYFSSHVLFSELQEMRLLKMIFPPVCSYYGPPGNSGYDQSAPPVDQYSQSYGATQQTAYGSNGYAPTGYQQGGYGQPGEYDHSQYSQDYK